VTIHKSVALMSLTSNKPYLFADIIQKHTSYFYCFEVYTRLQVNLLVAFFPQRAVESGLSDYQEKSRQRIFEDRYQMESLAISAFLSAINLLPLLDELRTVKYYRHG
jgi:hypothetical protein